MTRNLIFFFSHDCILLYMPHLLLFAVCHCLKLVLFQTFVELDKKLFRLGHSSPSAWVYAFYEIETPNIVTPVFQGRKQKQKLPNTDLF